MIHLVRRPALSDPQEVVCAVSLCGRHLSYEDRHLIGSMDDLLAAAYWRAASTCGPPSDRASDLCPLCALQISGRAGRG